MQDSAQANAGTNVAKATVEAQKVREIQKDPEAIGLVPEQVSSGVQKVREIQKDPEARRLQEQCFLVQYIEAFQAAARAQLKFKYFTAVEGDSWLLMNTLVRRAGIETLMQLTPVQLSALVPTIRLYKTYFPTEDSEGYDVELRFDEHVDKQQIEYITSHKEGIPSGIGLKSFHVKVSGGARVGSIPNTIETEMVLRFNALEDLDRPQFDWIRVSPWSAPVLREARFIDLCVPVTKYFMDSGFYNEDYFQIKVVFGWAVPQGIPEHVVGLSSVDFAKLKAPAIQSALRDCTTTMYLNWWGHQFDFKEDGAIELSFRATGRIEQVFRSQYCDILWSGAMEKLADYKKTVGAAAEEELTAMTDASDCPEEKGKSEEEQKQAETIRQEREELLRRPLMPQYRYLLQQLEGLGKIFYVDIPPDALRKDRVDHVSWFEDAQEMLDTVVPPEWLTQQISNVLQVGTMKQQIDTMMNTDLKQENEKVFQNIAKSQSESPNTEQLRINYFFLGDLIDTALRGLSLRSRGKANKIKVLLGSIAFEHPLTKKIISVCLSDIPVSLNLFMQFYLDKVVLNREITSYPLWNFLQDLVTFVLPPALGEACWRNISSMIADVGMQTLTIAKREGQSILPENRTSTDVLRTLSVGTYLAAAAGRQCSETESVLVIFANSLTANKLTGNWLDDGKLGIYHFGIGQDRGLIKKITFKVADMAGVRDVRIGTEDPKDPLARVRQKYNADIEMFGTLAFVPGQKIYIHPVTLGTGNMQERYKLAEKFYLGGYYNIIQTESTLERGVFNTTLTCIWERMRDQAIPPQSTSICVKKTAPAGVPVSQGIQQKTTEDRNSYVDAFIEVAPVILERL
jgi:hypothetical protein